MSNNHFGAVFIKRISAEVLDSSAVNHPYLQVFSNGGFPNFNLALKDFAVQYGLYSASFIRCLSAVIEQLSNNEHKQTLLCNLAEEKGKMHDIDLPEEIIASIQGQPHTRLYQRFQTAVGVDTASQKNYSHSEIGQLWSKQFLQLCNENEYVGVGAIGIGTELIVSSIYRQILKGLKAHSSLTVNERVFFDLHSQCDDDHAEQLLTIAEELAVDERSCQEIERGAMLAVNMRTMFWDQMLVRAQNISSKTMSPEEESEFGYEASL